MTVPATLMTADDLLNLPKDNLRHELVRGELTTMSPTNFEHGKHTGRLARILGNFIEAHDLGDYCGAETGFIVSSDPDTVRAPDFAFVRKDRAATTGRQFMRGAPDLVVEVLSPSDSASEVIEKIDEWLAAGARLVWIVDPVKKTVSIHAPNRQPHTARQNDSVSGEDVLPGLSLPLADIFR